MMTVLSLISIASINNNNNLLVVEAFHPIALTTTTTRITSTRITTRTVPKTRTPKTIMYRIRCENKYYQLEELEDAENCTTELFLKENGSVEIGETDGPLFVNAIGNWEISNNKFAMSITKKFKVGNDRTDMGEFTFEVERVFEGDMTVVGGTEVAVNGKIFAEDLT